METDQKKKLETDCTHTHKCTYIYVGVCWYILILMHILRERERERLHAQFAFDVNLPKPFASTARKNIKIADYTSKANLNLGIKACLACTQHFEY